jgi:energy-coupling factor transport system ATP-binding protein
VSATAPGLRVDRLSFAYGRRPVLNDVSLDVDHGEIVGLLGRNGSGKTTLLKCIVGLLRPAKGSVTVDGKKMNRLDPADVCRVVGYLPQVSDFLLFSETVRDELEVTLRNHGQAEKSSDRVRALLDWLHLADVAASYPRDLSVGQRQRVALAAITVVSPRILLLDEPTRGLDYETKRSLARLLRDWKKQGMGILLVTHDVEFAAQVVDRVVILEDGRLCAIGPFADVAVSHPSFAPQIARLFPGTGWLTVHDALNGRPMDDLTATSDL